METFVDIISDIGAQISKIKRCRINQQTLYKNYTLHQLLDELDVIECFEDANHSLRIGELLNKQAKIYEALGVKVPTSSC